MRKLLLMFSIVLFCGIYRSQLPMGEETFSSEALTSALTDFTIAGGSVAGKVVSATDGESLVGANVVLVGTRYGAASNSYGEFFIKSVPPGQYEIHATILGYKSDTRSVVVRENQQTFVEFALTPLALQFPDVEIIGSLPNALQKIPGSGSIIPQEMLLQTHPVSTNEVLRKVPGIHVREEEGLGLRPNIGIRGLFPTRSTKVLLLEDGIPFSLAPYGDPASYYHPPINRFNRVEVLKGSGQILFGPQTIGGVINYMTPHPPAIPGGSIKLMSGNQNYLYGQLRYGGRWGNMGILFDAIRKQGNLARENSSTTLQDFNTKLMTTMDAHSSLSLKLNVYNERSNLTYAGITQIEFEENPYQNQFKDDWLTFNRFGTHLAYDRAIAGGNILSTTNIYGYFIKRDWWRQGNNGGTNSTNPGNTPGVRTVLNPTRNDGRNREYFVWGIDPRVRMLHRLFGIDNESDFGIRAHFEVQDRKQIEGDSPTARTGIIREDNVRKTSAYSAFIQNRFFLSSQWVLSVGLRLEDVHYWRTNNLNGASGSAQITEWIPGLGLSYTPMRSLTLFAGVHRGFSPPRVEDVISNTDGKSIELDAEKSWSYELGARTRVTSWAGIDVTLFRMDFENQIIASSLAGGSSTTLTNAGRTLHEGIEVKSLFTLHEVILDVAYTYLPTAGYRGTRYSAISPTTSISGNRLTYAPEHMATIGVGYSHTIGWDARVEAVYIADQFSDDLNTVEPTPNGRQGIIPNHTIWNLSSNYTIAPIGLTAFVTVKNMFDRVHIVDRSRGILPGIPRLIQGGLKWDF